jgi:hypothetical protein
VKFLVVLWDFSNSSFENFLIYLAGMYLGPHSKPPNAGKDLDAAIFE